MNNENPVIQQEGKRKALFRFVEGRVKAHINNAKQELAEGLETRIAYAQGLANLKAKLIETVPDKEEKLSALFESLALLPMADEETFVNSVSGEITDFIAANYTYEEIEYISRHNARYKNFELNRLVVFGITGDHVHLHTPITFLENPGDLPILFLDALKKLAERLKTDPELAGIKKITAESPLIVRTHKLLTRPERGFTLTYLDAEKGGVEISREKLIEIYGK